MDSVGYSQGFQLNELSEHDGEPCPDKHVHVDVRVESGGLRIVMDPFGEDHDILLMPWENGWSIVVHPHGQDPVVKVRLPPTVGGSGRRERPRRREKPLVRPVRRPI
jgi:hypothetical protein